MKFYEAFKLLDDGKTVRVLTRGHLIYKKIKGGFSCSARNWTITGLDSIEHVATFVTLEQFQAEWEVVE